MAPASRAATQYLQTQVQASTPLERVVLLYDAALRAIDAARDAMTRGDLKSRRPAVNKVLAIVSELQNTLDMERGGAIAADLDRLYDFVLTRVLDVITTQNAAGLDDAQRVLVPLRDAWQGIAAATMAEAGAAR
jgi:flagellar secretion chaperone FliS